MKPRPATGRKRILVVGPDAYRAGAQMSLLHVLSWLVGNYPAEFSLLLKSGGDLLDDYAGVLPTRVIASSPGGPRWRSIVRRVGRRLLRTRLDRVTSSEPADLIYANSVPSLDIALELAAEKRCPVVCHVHELDMAIQRFFSLARFREIQDRIDAYIAVSQAVAANLMKNHAVPTQRIHQIYEAIVLPDLRMTSTASGELRKMLGIPPHAFVVGGCGTMDWRKSPELFLQIALSLNTRPAARPLHFVWVGGHTSGWERDALAYDVERMGLREIVHFVGPQAEPIKYFSLFDVFMLTSREDPFPLVSLEAAALGVPTICFAEAGGMPEFVGDDAGFVVPYLDIGRAADCILLLVKSEELRLRLGRCAAERVKRHDIAVIGPQIAGLLDKYLR